MTAVAEQSEQTVAEGLRIRAWRHAHGLTQEQLAKHLGVVWLTVQRWETGKRDAPSFLWLALDRLDQLLAERPPAPTLPAPRTAGDNPF